MCFALSAKCHLLTSNANSYSYTSLTLSNVLQQKILSESWTKVS